MLFFEDYEVGKVEKLPSRRITKEEIIDFASKYDPQPHHLDEEAGRASMLGGLAASGWHTCCALIRMVFENPAEPSAFLGSPGVEEVRWRAPVFAGDVLTATSEIVELRASKSRPNMGLIKRHYDVTKQDGTLVMTLDVWGMIARRPSGGAE